jgi:hypothetical protein
MSIDHSSRFAARRLIAMAVLVAVGSLNAPMVRADDQELQQLKEQIKQLQKHVEEIEARENARQSEQNAHPNASVPTVPASSQAVATAVQTAPPVANAPADGTPSFYAGPVKVTLNGFVETMVVNRSRNESADWASNFNASIPFPNSHNYDLSEFHFTERQSRIAALAQGPSDGTFATEAYVETDFGGATNATNNESTSFAPRVRHFYADYQDITNGWYFLFGQTWSLVTGEKVGMMPRNENIPLTIDGQYLVGFDWLRLPQLRVVKTFDDNAFAVGFSAENPAAIVSPNATAGAPAITNISFYQNPGVSSAFVTTNNVTTDSLPDLVLKASADPGWGHYEVFGLNRWFRSRDIVAGSADNETRTGSGIGGSLLLPLVPKMLDFQASFLGGHGVGRYGSAQLPDVTVNPTNGALATLNGYQALAGLVYRPAARWTFMAYGGKEQVSARSYVVRGTGATPATFGYGYGSPLFSNAGCEIEGSALPCTANTSEVWDIDAGGWWKFYQGTLGNMQIGATWNYLRREIFSGIGGDPSTNINIVMVSFRYYPYQK